VQCLGQTILQEALNLHSMGDHLDVLSNEHEEHPVVSEELITISGNVRHTARFLEVLVAPKMRPLSEPGPPNARLAYR